MINGRKVNLYLPFNYFFLFSSIKCREVVVIYVFIEHTPCVLISVKLTPQHTLVFVCAV